MGGLGGFHFGGIYPTFHCLMVDRSKHIMFDSLELLMGGS